MDFRIFVECSSLVFAQPTIFSLSPGSEVSNHWVLIDVTLFCSQQSDLMIFWNTGWIIGVESLFLVALVCRLLEWWVDNKDGHETLSHACCLLTVSIFFSRRILWGDTTFFPPKTNWQRTPSAWFGSKMKASPPLWKGLPGGFFTTITKLPLERRTGSSMGIIVWWGFVELICWDASDGSVLKLLWSL